MENSKRIHLLSDTEVAELYVRPEFNIDEQTLYFTLNDAEQAVLDRYANTRTRTYFILQLGYFKAKQQFFKFNFEDVIDDTKFVIQTHFGKSAVPLSGGISRDYTRLQKQQILDLLDYRDWGNDVELPVSAQIGELLRYYPKGHSALRELLVYMGKQRIVIPSYRTLQDMFTAAFSAEEARLKAIIFSISAVQRDQLSNLLTREEGTSQLELIRVDQKDFQFTALRNEIDKASQLADLYELAKQFIPKLNLSQNAVRYYADVAEQYFTSRLRRLNKPQQWLHIICFVHHRYQQIMDSLVVSFLYHIRAVISGGKKHADAELAKHSSRMVVDFPKLAEFLAWFPERNKALSHNEVNQAAYDILPEKQFPELASFLAGNAFDKNAAKWRYYAKCTRLFSLYLRPILLVTPFVFYKEGNQLTALIDFLKTHYASGKNPATLRVPDDIRDAIPKKIQQYLTRESTELLIDPLLFEFYVYLKIYHQINRGKLCCNDSVSYGDVDYDLIDDARVDDADNVAAEFSYPKIRHYCDERLDEAIGALDLAWKTTTDNIQFDRNTGFNFKETKAGQQDWSLLYDSSEKLEDRFFKTLPKAEIADVVMFVGELAGMWDSFTHIKDRYNQIFKSTHVLNLIDDMQLRKAIRTARNRTEAYHQLQGLIRKIYNNVFKGRKIADNQVSSHATRLVANCIVAYNSTILNAVYEKMLKDNAPQPVIDEFARISPIAWNHLYFTGRYSFKKVKRNVDVEILARILELHLKQRFWKED